MDRDGMECIVEERATNYMQEGGEEGSALMGEALVFYLFN